MKLILGHFYPRIMNLYGDRGNIRAFCYRLQRRNIGFEVVEINLGDEVNLKKFDILFMGGGQDREQGIIYKDFFKRRKEIKEVVEEGIVFLAICGGYQLLGNYFDPIIGKRILGLGVFDLYTKGDKKRLIGNIVTKTNFSGKEETLVGFENHSGRTYLNKNNPKIKPLGKVVFGYGNNGEDQTEGAVYKNAIGTYLHGSFLPKNPRFADHLIKLALKRKFGREIELKDLDDYLEEKVHQQLEKIGN